MKERSREKEKRRNASECARVKKGKKEKESNFQLISKFLSRAERRSLRKRVRVPFQAGRR